MRKFWQKSQRQRGGRKPVSDTITVEELADRLRIGRNQAYDAVRSGQIPAFRIGRRWIISDAVIDKILSGQAAPARASTTK
jgi:excisionase family DNA binding protein